MFKSYLKAMLRNLWNNKTYSFLNIFGLAIGVVCAGVIFLWVEDEVNYDNANIKKDRLYAIRQNWDYKDHIRTAASTPGPMAAAIKAEIPGIKNTARTTEDLQSMLFSIGEKSFYASGYFADSAIFSMFTMPFLQGTSNGAFTQLYSIVLTEKAAKKFFGTTQNVIGKAVKFDNQHNLVVTGVIKDFPENSTVQFEWIAPFEVWVQMRHWEQSWSSNTPFTYVEVEDNANIAAINKQLYNFVQTKEPAAIQHAFLFSMNDWRLRSEFENGVQTGGRIEYVRMFSIIAWVILFIACINFMNLSTARSEKRAREVGVRKVMGAGKKGLIARFIGEALFMSLLAAVLAVLIITLILPACNTLMQKNLSIGLNHPSHIAGLLLITLICGLVAGSYPSLYLSSFNPVVVLKGLKVKAGSATFVRKGLVVLQFTVSIVLIICTVIVYQQIGHIKSRDLGFKKNNLLAMSMQGEMNRKYDIIRQELINTGLVENAGAVDRGALYGGNNTSDVYYEGKAPDVNILYSIRLIDPGYVKTLGMELLEGRDFNANTLTDSFNIIITETMAKLLGSGSALGKVITLPDGPFSKDQFKVVGVVKDYIYGDMYSKPDPVLFFCLPGHMSTMYIRPKTGYDLEKTLAKIESVVTQYNPGYPFSYRFVDDQFNDFFTNEMLISKLANIFAALAIVISCLGLFGLAAYTAERRTKEIGVRKVLGASVSSIARLLSRDFLKMVCLSALIAFPIAWYTMNTWLQNYAYRVAIHWWVFLIAGIAAVLISLLTVSYQSVRAAVMNPVKSLKAD